MAHGQPDFGMYALAQTIYRLADMGELAVRLGSIDTFDRRGDVVWLDDFEDNIAKWEVGSSGIGGAVALSTEAARNGGSSVKLTTGDVINNNAYIRKWLPRPALSKVGFEISFTTDNDLNLMEFTLVFYNGTTSYYARIAYYPDVDELYYLDENVVLQLLDSGLNLHAAITRFHALKLVADLVNMKYVRLLLDERTYDLSSYAMAAQASAVLPSIRATLYNTTGVAANQSVYADDAIITQNEP